MVVNISNSKDTTLAHLWMELDDPRPNLFFLDGEQQCEYQCQGMESGNWETDY
jgi:hypothetical protein